MSPPASPNDIALDDIAPDDIEGLLGAIELAGPKWAARTLEADSVGHISAETAREVRALGLHRVLQPKVHGGGQTSIEAHMRIVAAVGEHCTSTAWCLAVWSAHNWMIGSYSPEGQADIWADPAALSSASIVPKTEFRTAGDDVVVQGRFAFGSGCDHADWLGVGGLVMDEKPMPVIAVVPRDEVTIDHDSWNVVGLRGTGSKDLVIDEPLTVPGHRVLRVGDAAVRQALGQQGDDRMLFRAPWRPTAAIVLAPPALGAAKTALQRFADRLDGRVMMLTRNVQREDPAAALRYAESSAEINAAELVLLEAARRLDALAYDDDPDPAVQASVLRDTAYGVRLCASAVDRLYEASGGSALQADEPISQLWRDVHAARSHAVLTWDAAATNYAAAAL